MLRKAQDRVAELGLTHVEQLAVMDASDLDFPDASFDVVVAQYVVTTVADPEAALDEFARVLKPGGEIILLSRVSDESGLRRSIEHWLAPAARALGWRTEFGLERYLAWAAGRQRYRPDRTPAHAAVRPFRTHPLRQNTTAAAASDSTAPHAGTLNSTPIAQRG